MPREDDVEIISIDDEEDSSSVDSTRMETKEGPRTYPHDDEVTRLWRKLEGEYYLYRQRGGQYPKQPWHTGEESLYVNYPLRRESMHHPDWSWENDWEYQFPNINLFLNNDYYRWLSETHAKEIMDTEGDYPFLSIEAARAAWKQRRLNSESSLKTTCPRSGPIIYSTRTICLLLVQYYALHGLQKHNNRDTMGDRDYFDVPSVPMCNIRINEIMTAEQQRTSGHSEDYFAPTIGPADQLYYYTHNLEDEATAAADGHITITTHRPEDIEPDILDARTHGHIGDKHSGRNHQWTTKVYEQHRSRT